MAYTRIDTGLADFDRDHPWKKEYVSHMEDGIDDCESQCSELKDSLTELETVSSATVSLESTDEIAISESYASIFFYKYGRVVLVNGNVSGQPLTSGVSVTIGTIPEGFRPARNTLHSYNSQAGLVYFITFNTNGTITLNSQSTKSTTDWLFRQAIAYLAAE